MAEHPQSTNGFRLRSEAARWRRVAEGLTSKGDRAIIIRLAEETEQAAASWERSQTRAADLGVTSSAPSDI